MFRFVGFILGCAATIGVFSVLVGVPEFRFENVSDDAQRFDAAIDKLKRKQRRAAADSLAQENPPAEAVAVDSAPEEIVAQAGTNETHTLDTAALEIESPTSPAAESRADAANLPGWHTFWSPFRSEIAAMGFVRRLERVTGLDYRVEKVETGVYEVAFAYRTSAERVANLAQISSATGLDLAAALP